MNPLLIVAVSLRLVILGMILNSWELGFNQPPSSPEQDPVKNLTAEKESYRKFFDLQRSRSVKRQKRAGQYAWLVLASFIGASGRSLSSPGFRNSGNLKTPLPILSLNPSIDSGLLERFEWVAVPSLVGTAWGVRIFPG